MTSFISTLSLFLLVLANGYFTFPLNNEPLQTSTMLLSNVDVTSERPLVPREWSMNQVRQTTELPMDSEMSSSSDNLRESTSRETGIITDESKADKRGLNDLLLTTVESTTEEDDDSTTEDNTTMVSQSEQNNIKREVSLDLTTTASSLTPASSASSLVDAELTTEESSGSKPSNKFTGLLKDKEENLDQDKKEKDGEEKTPVKPSKKNPKVKEDDKEKSDDEDKEKSSKKNKQEKEDDEDKKKSSKKQNKEKDDDKDDDKDKSGEGSKKPAAPIAQLDSEGMKNIVNYQKEYMDLDENSSFTVTQSGSTDSTTTLKYKKGKKPLNEGEESSAAKEKESD